MEQGKFAKMIVWRPFYSAVKGSVSYTHLDVYKRQEQGCHSTLYPKMEVSMKVLQPKLEEGARLMTELLTESCLEDTRRLKEIIGQLKSRLEMMMNGSGHMVAVNRANSFQSLAGIYKEYEEGLSYYRFIENLNKNFEDLKEEIVSNLKETLDRCV